ncbi:glycosyltransferase family 1 protein [Lentinula aff. detonsa]|uniref:sterol 3beta-glucosyltransferase n=1 Tax=Lentinula aff. detonsa TaxID=2804958 RepID=A0AA38KXZ1_9AGAR|nr:glycosyltransferase family 1 protein [Lentinula aff. detonsa]
MVNPSFDTDNESGSDSEFLPPYILSICRDANEFDKVIRDDPTTKDGFDELVAKDLDQNELAAVGRSARLDVAGTTWTDAEFTSEPESYSDDTSLPKFHPQFHRVATTEGDSWKLSQDELVKLLVQEFGPLGEDEEKLIFEADALMFSDVLIVGVLHLTTHRLTFHASLLSARPDLPPSQQVIKAGPVTIHLPRFHKKRRLWLELTHDMMCTYISSSPDDHIRPLRSILLSSILEISLVDPNNPRTFQVACGEDLDITGTVEFDTEESAHEWRKEVSGAVFLQRHRRREAIGSDFSNINDGIRVSYPLHKIEKVKMVQSFSKDVAIIQVDGLDQNEGQLYLGPILRVPAWLALEDHVNEAKRRVAALSTPPEAPVVVDMGPLTFAQDLQSLSSLNPPVDAKEKVLRNALGLGEEPEIWCTRARVFRKISCLGYFVVSPHYVGFWGKYVMKEDVRYRLPMRIIVSASPISGKIIKIHGLCLEIEGSPDLKFQFKTQDIRDEVIRRINNSRALLTSESYYSSTPALTSASSSISSTPTSSSRPETPQSSNFLFSPASPAKSALDAISPLERGTALLASAGMKIPMSTILSLPKVINMESNILISHPPMHFVCLTIGSRGDVQPYIALGVGLKKENHRVTIVTHEEYRGWIEGFGLEFKQAGGDPGALMKLSVENKMFSPEFFKESLANFRPWLDQLLVDAWESCQGADVLLESPSAMAGVHIAEALHIPYFRTFTMPWTKTSEFPHAFLSPPVDSPTFNSASYVLFNNVMWAATSGQINRWRRNTLKIGNTDMGHLMQSKIVFIYNFSQAVVPKPLDWGDPISISGYWFLDNPDLDWEPPESLIAWMEKARADGKPIVYIGFGSITVPNPNRVTLRIIEAVLKSDVRAIISKGWSARMSKTDGKEPVIPPECYQLDKIPHDWLFPQVDAALHHGGAGTTGASLRAGIPTLIKPWFGDQFFWASRVQKLGAGMKVSSLRVNELADALTKATTSRIMKEKAMLVGEKIRAENGVRTAIRTIYTYIPRASRDRTLLK